MNKNRRKRLLLAGLGLIAVFYAGDWVLTNWIEKPKQQRKTQIVALQNRIKEYDQKYISRAQREIPWLRYWYSQSLPTNSEVAQSLYRAWLLEVGEYVGIAGRQVNATEPVRRGAFYSMNFSMRGRGTLDQLTEFLYEFYNAGHLHKITSISMTPVGRGGMLDLSVVIEALILPGANRPDRLGTGRAYRLASMSLDDYQTIPDRNLFSAGGGGSVDPVSHTYLTAVPYVGDEPQAWFTLRTTGAVMKLRRDDHLVQTGDTLRKLCRVEDLEAITFDGTRSEIGSIGEIESGSVLVAWADRIWEPTLSVAGNALEFRPFDSPFTEIGRVVDMEETEVVLQSGDERWLLSFGDALNDAFALPPEMF
ncbi:MAG: hypothetical protein GXX96_00940 [Planctomycetaceae bacterium]|nr:hypothetical protein [Planctomycetaceae bacterium]